MITDLHLGLDAPHDDPRVVTIAAPGEPHDQARLNTAWPADDAEYLATLRTLFTPHENICNAPATRVHLHRCPSHWGDLYVQRLTDMVHETGNSVDDAWTGTRHTLANCQRWPSRASHLVWRSAWKGRPAIALAAGPTADDHWEEIRAAVAAGAALFACDVMLDACHQHGLAPDFVCSLERVRETIPLHRHAAAPTRLWAGPVLHPDAVAPWQGRIVWAFNHDALYRWLRPGDWIGVNHGPSVGVMTIAAALECGCAPISLIGHDCSRPPGHSTHAAEVHPEALALADHIATHANPLYREHAATDLFGEPCRTNGLWRWFAQAISDLSAWNPGRLLNVRRRGGLPIPGLPLHQSIPLIPWSGETELHDDAIERRIDRQALRQRAHDAIQRLPGEPDDLTPQRLFGPDAGLFGYLLGPIYGSCHLRRALGCPHDQVLRRLNRALALHLTRIHQELA